MRQGDEVTSKGKWTGDPSGGVKAPEALILPDPVKRFSDTAMRLEATFGPRMRRLHLEIGQLERLMSLLIAA